MKKIILIEARKLLVYKKIKVIKTCVTVSYENFLHYIITSNFEESKRGYTNYL